MELRWEGVVEHRVAMVVVGVNCQGLVHGMLSGEEVTQEDAQSRHI